MVGPLRVVLALFVFFLAGLSSCTLPSPESGELVVYLVRHAERADDGTADPPISEAGQERAQLLATMLSDAKISEIHSTDYLRTRETVAPAASLNGIKVSLYDARDLPSFAATLRSTPGRHLVVGHSNTTPELVAELGGEPGAPITEREYDRLYVLTVREGSTSTVVLRYGNRSR